MNSGVGVLRAVCLSGTTLLSFVICCVVFESNWDDPQNSRFYKKLKHYEEHKDHYDTLFFGNSRMYRHLDPLVFDEVMADHGIESRSFNIAHGALTGLEAEYELGKIAAVAPENLKWVVIDVGFPVGKIWEENLLTTRNISWHDLETTLKAIVVVSEADEPLSTRIGWTIDHLRSLFYRSVGIGRGVEWIRNHLFVSGQKEKDVAAMAQIAKSHGFRSLSDLFEDPDDPGHDDAQQRRRKFLSSTDVYLKQVRTYAAQMQNPPQGFGATERGFAERVLEAVRRLGARPIFLVSTTRTMNQYALRHLHDEGVIPTLFYYADPEQSPELYDVDRRFDQGHLDEEGARDLTRRFARDVAPLMQGN